MSDGAPADSLELARVLEQMKLHGLIGRATSVKVGVVEIFMLPAPQEAVESDARRDRRADQDHIDTLFGSA